MVQLCLNRNLNMRNRPGHFKIRMELVFHTTSGASQSGPPSTYLNVVTVSSSRNMIHSASVHETPGKIFPAQFRLRTAITSSTAQGGGGSFKNRKPIGELGCCESGMAERSH